MEQDSTTPSAHALRNTLIAPSPTTPGAYENDATREYLYQRRHVLKVGAMGAAALAAFGLGRKATAAVDCSPHTALTEGPYWVDEMLNRSDIRSNPANGALQAGLPLRLMINVSEVTGSSCAPLSGAYVDIWHCNAGGLYSDVAANGTVGQKWLRGYQVTDAHGNARFLTIFPGYYNGRTVHIHFRVRKFSGTVVTFNFVSQLFFTDAMATAIFNRVSPYNTRAARTTVNTNDGIYNQGGARLLCRASDNGTHAVASFNCVVNSVPGLLGLGTTPADEDSIEHLYDFGGGTPPLTELA